MAHSISSTLPNPRTENVPAAPNISLEGKDEITNTAANGGVEQGVGEFKPPESILIIGSGVFGLSTALSLTRCPEISSGTSITIIDRSPDPDVFPARDAASIDSSRIIRADYADAAYAKLAAEAQTHWRRDPDDPDSLGGGGRYSESGMLLAADTGGDGATMRADGHPTGLGYAKRSWVNALALAHAEGRPLTSVRLTPHGWSIGKCSRTDGEWADWGYLNTAAGWADAEKSMRWLYDRVMGTGRVTFVNGTVVTLETPSEAGEAAKVGTGVGGSERNRVTGARLSDGRRFAADLVIVAAGAWTPSLVDLTGQVVATGQCLAYMQVTDEEQARLAEMPVLLNLSDGCFIIPPRNGVLKIARHAYGYLNPQPVAHEPLGSRRQPTVAAKERTVSQPRTQLTEPSLSIPAEAASDLRRALKRMIPWPELAERPFFKTRLCWYTDTATGDWIIDYHPSYKNLFVATGGSGHAFKFLPILGDKIVECLLGRYPNDFREKWKWKGNNSNKNAAGNGKTMGNDGESAEGSRRELDDELAVERSIATEDGSRAGKPGLILPDEINKNEVP